MSELPWSEKVPMLSIHPDAASRDDIARLAGEYMDLRARLNEARTERDLEVEWRAKAEADRRKLRGKLADSEQGKIHTTLVDKGRAKPMPIEDPFPCDCKQLRARLVQAQAIWDDFDEALARELDQTELEKIRDRFDVVLHDVRTKEPTNE